MACEGCVNAVKRILSKTEGKRLWRAKGASRSSHYRLRRCAGVESFEVDLATKKVSVKGTASAEELVEKVSKMGKETRVWT